MIEELQELYRERGFGWYEQVIKAFKECVAVSQWTQDRRDRIFIQVAPTLADVEALIKAVRYESIENLRDNVLGSKGAWIIRIIPEWNSYRPWRQMSSSDAGKALKRWLICEHDLEIETGRFRRVAPEMRWCRYCMKHGRQVIGDERHALGTCLRGYDMKVQIAVDLLELFWRNEICLDDDDGLQMHIHELLAHVHKLPCSEQAKVWRWTARLMLKINTEILHEQAG